MLRKTIRNNGGGFVNHDQFWKLLGPNSKLSTRLNHLLSNSFGSVEEFQTKFGEAATKLFGSGWVWLLADNQNNLSIHSFPNQDNTYMTINKFKPILGLDVWEHAYYLKYQNKRVKYVEAFWNIVNWDHVESLLVPIKDEL